MEQLTFRDEYRRLLEKEHDVFIYARSDHYAIGDSNWDDKQVTWGRRLPFVGKTAFDLRQFRQWLRANSIEVVIFNEQHWWPPVLLCNEMGIKTGAYIDYYTEETVPLFAAYDFLVCHTRRHYSVFDWHPQCLYLPWGTELNLFKPRSFDPVEPGKTVFFHSSGMSPQRKGTDLVIEAFDTLPETTHLVIHSQRPILDGLPECAKKIEELRSCGRLILHECSVPAPGLYHLGDVYVYPTRLEGIGLTMVEALSCGLPVITTDCPPMNEFVTPGNNGSLVAVDRLVARADGYYWPQSLVNVTSLRQQMMSYVGDDSALAISKRRARAYAEQFLDWHKNAAELPEFTGSVLKQPVGCSKSAGEAARRFETKEQPYPKSTPSCSMVWLWPIAR